MIQVILESPGSQLHEWLLLEVNSSWRGPHTFPRQLDLTREELLGLHVLSFDSLVLNKTFTLANLFVISCRFFFFPFLSYQNLVSGVVWIFQNFCFPLLKIFIWEIPWRSRVWTQCFSAVIQDQSLVGELRSHRLCGLANK